MTFHSDRSLATRLERLCADEMERFVVTSRERDAGSTAETLPIAGGSAVFVSAASPLNQVFGVGMQGAVADGDVAAIERFYRSRDARALMNVCPFAHPTLLTVLAARRWTPEGFENVLTRTLDAGDATMEPVEGSVEIRTAVTAEEKRTWALVAASAFCAPLPPLDEQILVAELATARPGTRLFTAHVGGRPAGTGELYIAGDVGWLSADATLPAFRQRGVQLALQRHRLALAARSGCRLAVAEAAPGGASQRNMERLGFRVAYTRLEMAPPHAG